MTMSKYVTAAAEYAPPSTAAQRAPRPPRTPADALRDYLVNRPQWMQRAACRGMSIDTFYLVEGDGDPVEAKAICAVCPVVDECLAYAVDRPESFGVWGGVAPKKRDLSGSPFVPPLIQEIGGWSHEPRRPETHR